MNQRNAQRATDILQITPLLDSLTHRLSEPPTRYIRKRPAFSNFKQLAPASWEVYHKKISKEFQDIPGAYFVKVRNVWASKETLFVDDLPIVETFAHPLTGGFAIQRHEAERADNRWQLLREERSHGRYSKYDTGVFCQRPGSAGNYGHFLTDSFPVIFAAIRDLKSEPLVLPKYGRMASSQINLVRNAFGDPKILLHGHVSFFRELWVPLGFNSHVGRPGEAKWKRASLPHSLAEIILEGRSKGAEEIFSDSCLLVTRDSDSGRNPRNLGQISDLLSNRFKKLERYCYSGQSIFEQARIFSRHDFVVGVRGADMANTLFMNPGGRVIHLCPHTFSLEYFWDISCINGLVHTEVYGESKDDGNDFDIDLAVLCEAINATVDASLDSKSIALAGR